MIKTYPPFPIFKPLSAPSADTAVGAANTTISVPAGTVWVRLVSTVDCRLVFGGAASLTTGSVLPAGVVEFWDVSLLTVGGAGSIGVITNQAGLTGAINVTPVQP